MYIFACNVLHLVEISWLCCRTTVGLNIHRSNIDTLFYLTLSLLRLFQQHYCYNVTGQSQESDGPYKPARIKEVQYKLHSFQASLCTYTDSYSLNPDKCLHLHSAQCTVRLLNQAGTDNCPYNPKFVGNTVKLVYIKPAARPPEPFRHISR